MANRSYLYSCNTVPGHHAETKHFAGLSEWNYSTPLIYKILLSANPEMCTSSIWDIPEKIAIVGEYEQGVKNLESFLEQIKRDDAQPLLQEALSFLKDEANRNEYFVLECGELYEMSNVDIFLQNKELFDEIEDIKSEYEYALWLIQRPLPAQSGGLLSRLFNRQKPPSNTLDSIHALGLGNWSNELYQDLSDDAEELFGT